MKILHISRPDNQGAGSFVYDIHNTLLSYKDIESKIIIYYDTNAQKNGSITYLGDIEYKIKYWIKRVIRKILKTYRIIVFKKSEIINHDYAPHSIFQQGKWEKGIKVLEKSHFVPDIIIFYFIDYFLNMHEIRNLYSVSKAKIIFYPADMALFTGGCHYAWDCLGYTKNCGYCPAIFSNNEFDQSRKTFLYKKKELSKINYTLVVANTWLYKQAQKSSLFGQNKIYKLILPVNETIFCPQNMDDCRSYYKLPLNKRIAFIGAQNLGDHRKGFRYLLDALLILKKEHNMRRTDMFFLIAGKKFEYKEDFPFEFKYVGSLGLYSDLPKAYNAADIYISPSIEDSGPMMINQSIMCGTPVVSFEMGVALDLIITGETGYMAKLKDSKDLAIGIKKLISLEKSELKKMRKKCRELGLNECGIKKQSEKLVQIVDNL